MGEATVLFCVGATKAGTGWLYEYLCGHPECYFRTIKELHYFDALESGTLHREITKHEDRKAVLEKKVAGASGTDMVGHAMKIRDRAEWLSVLKKGEDEGAYLTYLNGDRTDERVVGDLTPAYALLSERRLRSMADLGARVRFLYVLRDPVERIWSHIRMIAARRAPAGEVTAERAAKIVRRTLTGDENHIAFRSDYSGNIRRLQRAVGDRLKVVFYEELFDGDGLAEVCRHLGIAPLPGPKDAVVHPGQSLDLLPEQRLALRDWLAPQYDDVRTMVGRVPDGWR